MQNPYPDLFGCAANQPHIQTIFMLFTVARLRSIPFFHPIFKNNIVGAGVTQIECPLHPLTCIHVCWQRDLWLKPPSLVYFPQPKIGCSHVQVTLRGRLISRYATRPPLNCAVCNSFACSVSLARNYGLEHWMMAINHRTGLFRPNINIYPDSFPLLASLAFSSLQTQW